MLKTLKNYTIILYFLLAVSFLGLLPYIIWQLSPSQPLQVWILDKTVPINDFREHKGLMWALNYFKINNELAGKAFHYDTDYYGFFPNSKNNYYIKDLPSENGSPDLVYIADTYGVYQDDYLTANQQGNRSPLIYGGLSASDMSKIRNALHDGNTLIAESNSLASPTSTEVRSQLEALMGIHWSGWMGRYFVDLTKDKEVPTWLVANYEKQYGAKWDFQGSGIALVSDKDQVVILQQGLDIGKGDVSFSLEKPYEQEFRVGASIPYYYWFEFVQPGKDTEAIASYNLDLTETGSQKLQKIGLKSSFPAIVRKKTDQFSSYYFAGDFADNNKVPSWWQYWGLDLFEKWTNLNVKGQPDAFYWRSYVPIMKKILSDIKQQKASVNPTNKAAVADTPYVDENGISYVSKVDSKYFDIYQNGQWKKTFIKGVNIGVGAPGKFPGELGITEDQYLGWFKEISDMNANTIRVYTTQTPDFYRAFYEYNRSSSKKLYLIQGVWINEDDIAKYENAFDPHIIETMKSDTKDIINILHGKAILPSRPGFASGSYTKDVSNYVLGYIIGIESDAQFVNSTNAKNAKQTNFNGKYLYTKDASPFEVFWAQVEDYAIDYETANYKTQKPIAFTNWPTTDMLKHANEPFPETEDSASINPEHVLAKSSYKAGVFASYHIYPYYPDFMNYQKEYISHKNNEGNIDTYQAYLNDLIKQHNMPVLVAEFGVPSSRGITHVGPMGFNQGGLTEQQQGNMDAYLINDIYNAGYAGGLVFSWQDEWFKRTWNTMDFDMADRRAYWSNAQTSEQSFGMLTFDPGEDKSVCYVDGDISEWAKDTPVTSSNNLQLYAKADEKYLYLLLKVKGYNIDKDTVLVPIASIPNQGNTGYDKYNITLPRPSDFILEINGKTNSRILVDAYYDSFYYLYAKQNKLIARNENYEKKDTHIFNPEYLCLSKGLYLPEDKKTVPLSSYETGKLTYGNGNPDSKDYNSLADFIVQGDNIEIRIPWQLLNVEDPSSKMVMDDLYKNGIKPIKSNGFYLEEILLENNKEIESTDMKLYSWSEWDRPTYHERLKQSYYLMSDAFAKIK